MSTATKKEQEITKIKLRKTYGAQAITVLMMNAFINLLPRKKKEIQRYRVVKLLPSLEDFNAMRAKHFTVTVDSLVDEAFSEFEDLASELDDWYNNLPESFQSGDKGYELEEARDALQNISRPDVPESIAGITVVYIPPEDIDSRSARRDNAAAKLSTAAQAVADELSSRQDNFKAANPEAVEDSNAEYQDEDGLEDFASELESAAQEAEGVEFPGMY